MTTPTFTLLLPTRNRPALLQRALASVLAQRIEALEVVVIDDGSTAPLEVPRDPRLRVLRLPPGADGHGPCHALNAGAALARGRYLGFLDDDDEWTDPHHLARARDLIAAAGPPPDLLFFDQDACRSGQRIERPIWLEDLGPRLRAARPPGPGGAFRVTAAELLRAQGFCHVNTTLVRLAFFRALGGFDPALRYEGDRDFYLRAIDRAQAITYAPRCVARHTVPDPARQDNVSTLVSDIGKRRCQVALLDKAVRSARQEVVRAYARRHRGYALRHLALALHRAGCRGEASRQAVAALRAGFTLPWLAVCGWLAVRAVVPGSPRDGRGTAR